MLRNILYRRTFDRLFREHYGFLYSYAYHIVGNEEDSRDIVSAVFEGLWNNIQQFDADKAKPYLMVSVRNRCVDFLRKSKLHNQYTEEYLHTLSIYYDDLKEQQEQDLLVKEMLDKLPENTRTILEMCYLKRMKYVEVAAELSISTATVKKHIVKALKLLRIDYSKNKSS